LFVCRPCCHKLARPLKGNGNGEDPSSGGAGLARCSPVAGGRSSRRAWHRLRRYWHQPPLRAQAGCSSGRNAVVRNRHRHRVADPVDPDPDRLVQIRDPHNARRQSRGRWNRRALGAPRCPACASQELARLPLDSRVDRRSVALWRRCHHPGDLGVERNRGPEARCPSTRTDGCADQPCDPGRPLPSAAQGDGVHRR